MAAIWTVDQILEIVEESKKEMPRWPETDTSGAGIISKNAANVMQEALALKYSHFRTKTRDEHANALRIELIRTAASCIRMLENL